MSKEDVLAEYDVIFKKYENDKTNFVNQVLLERTKQLIVKDRLGVVEALRYWLSSRESGLTVAVANLIADVNIPELKPELKCLRKEIESGKIFHPYYNYCVDRALKAISENP
jgi:hypothetical protein